jgi:hypothetical protein
VGAQLHLGAERQRGDGTGPRRRRGPDLADPGEVRGTDGDRAGDRLDAQHVARPGVADRDAQPAALADREAVGAGVLPHRGAGAGVDDRARLCTEPLRGEPAGCRRRG